MSSNDKKIRIFWGVELNQPLQKELISIRKTLEADNSSHLVRWIQPENLHLTLRFMGEQTKEWVEQYIDSVNGQLKTAKIFEIALHKIQYFPKDHPHVIACIVTLNEALAQLYHIVETGCVQNGLAPEGRPYLPHISIARLKTKKIPDLSLPLDFSAQQSITEIILFKSEPTKEGQHYVPLYRVPLLC